MTPIAKRIQARRKEIGMTQTDLALAVGVSPAAVAQWEDGTVQNLKNPHLFAVADALNVSARWLAEERGPKVLASTDAAFLVAVERMNEAKTQEAKRGWERIAKLFAKAALVVVVPTVIGLPAPVASTTVTPAYYVKYRNRLNPLMA